MTNRYTGQFYIGMRSANKVVAEEDLGFSYFTSSKIVQRSFADFDAKILAYFMDQQAAFEFENEMIYANWENPLLLNKHYQKSMTKFSMIGARRPDLAALNQLKRKPKEHREYTCLNCGKIFVKLEFAHHEIRQKPLCSQSCSGKFNGAQSGKKLKGKANLKNRGKIAWNYGKPNPHSADNARKGAEKVRQAAIGRKRKYREDGTWFWKRGEG